MNLEQIALKVAQDLDPTVKAEEVTEDFYEFARRLVAALGAQEPVAATNEVELDYLKKHGGLSAGIWKYGADPDGADIPLYTAPPICPTCTQMIDEAAREGRIVDDRIPGGWQLVPKEPTEEIIVRTAAEIGKAMP